MYIHYGWFSWFPTLCTPFLTFCILFPGGPTRKPGLTVLIDGTAIFALDEVLLLGNWIFELFSNICRLNNIDNSCHWNRTNGSLPTVSLKMKNGIDRWRVHWILVFYHVVTDLFAGTFLIWRCYVKVRTSQTPCSSINELWLFGGNHVFRCTMIDTLHGKVQFHGGRELHSSGLFPEIPVIEF